MSWIAAIAALALIAAPAAFAAAGDKARSASVGAQDAALRTAPVTAAARKGTRPRACTLRRKARCGKARLRKVRVGKVSLAGADLRGAVVQGGTFTGTNLTDVNLAGATITGTTFRDVRVDRLSLVGARLSNVTFVNARVIARAPAARQSECTSLEPTTDFRGSPADSITCTGGGVNLREARLVRSVEFRNSVIPRSDFSGMNVAGANLPFVHGVAFDGTDVSQSTFVRSAVLFSFSGRDRWSRAVGSVFDGSGIVQLLRTDARNSSFVGTAWLTQDPDELGGAISGARGLRGTVPVEIVLQGAAVPGLRTVQVREDGYFRPGVLCESLPCTAQAVAIGAPAVAVASGSSPLVLNIPGWTCAQEDSGTLFRSRCTTASVAGRVTGSVRVPAVDTKRVSLSVDDGGTPAQAVTASTLRIVHRSAPGAAPTEVVCDGQASCAADVPANHLVELRVGDAARAVAGQCPGASSGFMTAAGSVKACDAVAVVDPIAGRAVSRAGVPVVVNVVDIDTSEPVRIQSFSLSATAPGLAVAATAACGGTASCSITVPTGSGVVLTLGDPVEDLSGFCLAGQMFHWRLPGTVNSCPTAVITTPTTLRVTAE